MAQPIQESDPEHGFCKAGVEEYAARHSTAENPNLTRVSTETAEKMKHSVMVVGHLEGRVLAQLVKIARAKRVLEIGCYTGYSALAMAEKLPDDGELITLDNFSDESASRELALKFLNDTATFPYAKKIKLIEGKAIESLKQLEGTFDFIFMDADKEGQIEYYETILSRGLLAKPHGVLAVDNTLWYAKVVEDPATHDKTTKVTHEFNEHVTKDARTENVILTVRDGITLITWA